MSARAAFLAAACAGLVEGGCATTRRPAAPAAAKVAVRSAGRTVAGALVALRPAAEQRLQARFAAAGVAYPPQRVHLLAFKSIKLDYPNAFDRQQAQKDGRTNLGGDIFIHGSDASIGCLAVGDPAIEELFVLAARVGIEHVTAILAPWDLRRRPPPDLADRQLTWLPIFYARLSRSLAAFR